MALLARRHHVIDGSQTLNGALTIGPLRNLSRFLNPTMIVVLDSPNAVAGSASPTVTITVYALYPSGQRKFQLYQKVLTTALANTDRAVVSNLLEDNLEVDVAVSGTTPSLTGANLDLYFTSPDA